MNDWATLATGAGAGFIIGMIVFAGVWAAHDRRCVQKGWILLDGGIYRLARVNPGERIRP